MKLTDAKELIDQLAKMWPDQDVRLAVHINPHELDKMAQIRSKGFFTSLESSAYADAEIVVKDKCDEDVGPTRDETPPS